MTSTICCTPGRHTCKSYLPLTMAWTTSAGQVAVHQGGTHARATSVPRSRLHGQCLRGSWTLHATCCVKPDLTATSCQVSRSVNSVHLHQARPHSQQPPDHQLTKFQCICIRLQRNRSDLTASRSAADRAPRHLRQVPAHHAGPHCQQPSGQQRTEFQGVCIRLQGIKLGL